MDSDFLDTLHDLSATIIKLIACVPAPINKFSESWRAGYLAPAPAAPVRMQVIRVPSITLFLPVYGQDNDGTGKGRNPQPDIT